MVSIDEINKIKNNFINRKRKIFEDSDIFTKMEESPDDYLTNNNFILKTKYNPITLMKGEPIGLSYKKSKSIINSLNSQKIQIYKDEQIYGIKLKEDIVYNFNEINKNELHFDICRNKANRIINKLNSKKGREKLMNELYKSLSYDNTNQYIIYTVLNKLYELEYQNEFYDIIKEYRLLLCQEMPIKIKDENILLKLDNFYSLNDYSIPKNEQSLKNVLINIIEIILFLAELNILNDIKMFKNNYKELFRKEFKIDGEILLNIDNNIDENIKKEKKDMLEKIDELWDLFKNYKLIKKFKNNQPAEYKLNSNLFYIILINTRKNHQKNKDEFK